MSHAARLLHWGRLTRCRQRSSEIASVSLVDKRPKVGPVSRHIRKSSACSVIHAAIGADVGGVQVCRVVWQIWIISGKVVGNCRLLILGNGEVICETT